MERRKDCSDMNSSVFIGLLDGHRVGKTVPAGIESAFLPMMRCPSKNVCSPVRSETDGGWPGWSVSSVAALALCTLEISQAICNTSCTNNGQKSGMRLIKAVSNAQLLIHINNFS